MLFRRLGEALVLYEGMPMLVTPNGTGTQMNRIIYLVGLIVVIVFVLGLLGLR